MIIRPLNTDAEFLQRVLSSPRAISAIEDSSVGTTMVNLNQGTLAGLKVQFPPPPEQRAIAAALSDVDALLSGLERAIAKKRDLKQAATAVRLKREQIQLVVDGGAVGTGVDARKGLLQGHLLEKGDRQYL